MASKLDFNLLLAKADKNTNNACKILEEKKLQNQKIQQKHNQKNEQQSKQAAIDFLNKKREEIRQRTEKEAKELLEKKQKKNESQQQSIVSTTSSLSNNNSNKNIIQKKTNSNIPVKNKDVKSTSLKPTSSNKNEKSNSNKNQATSNNNNNNNKIVNPKPKTSESSKPKLSYSQILKLAENNQQDKLKINSTDNINSEIKKLNKLPGDLLTTNIKNKAVNLLNNNKQDNNFNNTISNKAQISNNRPNILKQMSNQTNVLTSKQTAQSSVDNKSKKESFDPRRTKQSLEIKSNTSINESKSISSWDRIISDMKKKKTIKKHDQSNIEPKIYDEYEDEDEYDSEMDDFIDDDDVDNNSIEKKNDYSKCIREIFKYNPNRYKADDEDDLDNMETDFHTLQKEEKRSLKLGILEDIEEMKKDLDLERQKKERLKKRQSDGEINNKNKKLKSKT